MILGFILIAINIFVIFRAINRRQKEVETREYRLSCDLEELERSGHGSPKSE